MSAVILTDDEEAIAELARDVVSRRAPLKDQHARASQPGPVELDRKLLSELGDLGFFSQAVASDAGGLGLSWMASGLVAEAMGTEILPGPWLDQLVTVRLLAAGGARLVEPYAAGTTVAALGIGAGTDGLSWDPAARTASGELGGIAWGDEVDRWIVPVDGVVLVLDPAGAGVGELEAEPTIDPLWRTVRVRLDGVTPEAVVDEGSSALDLLSCLVAAASVGAASRALAIAVDYVTERQQFGVAVGSFQAIKHRLANAHIEVLHARALVRRALADEGSDATWPARLAADHCARTVAEAALQVHGGIGFTAEVPIHLFLKRAQQVRAWPEPIDRAHDRVRARLGLDAPTVGDER